MKRKKPLNMQTLLTQFHGVLTKQNNLFKIMHSVSLFDERSLGSLKSSAKNCQDNKKNKTKSYEFPELLIKIIPPSLPRNCINPDNISNIEITLEASVTYSNFNVDKVVDPLHALYFVVSISSDKPKGFQSWHLDKQGDAPLSNYIHPEYHMTFGGSKLKEKKSNGFTFGEGLYFGTPRLMHPPMDFILGIDFILNHYVDSDYAKVFLEHEKYLDIVEQMKIQLWKPYSLALLKNYCHSVSVDNSELNIDSNFTKLVVGDKK